MTSSSPVETYRPKHQHGENIEHLYATIEKYTTASNSNEKLELLQILSNHLLPQLGLADLEAHYLAKVVPQVFDSIVDYLHSVSSLLSTLETCEDKESVLLEIQAILQAAKVCIEWLEMCVVHVSTFTAELSITDMHSLSPSVLKVAKYAYEHCQQSEVLYGTFLQRFSEELSAIFKKAYQLQKALMELVDKIQLNPSSEESEIMDLTEVCLLLLQICGVRSIDTNILVNTWKILTRLVIKHMELLKNHIDIDKIVRELCVALEAELNSCHQLVSLQSASGGKDKIMSKKIKVLRFLIGNLMNLVKEYFDFIDGCLPDVLYLLVTLESDNTHKVPSSDLREIMSSVKIVVEPLVKVLINNKTFAKLATSLEEVHRNKLEPFGFCQVLLHVANALSTEKVEVVSRWMSMTDNLEERSPLLQAIMETLQKCSVELVLPVYVDGVMCQGKPLRQVSFYEFVCTRLCTLIATAPSSCFHAIESCLVDGLLSDDMLVELVSSDLWTFMARWESADLCRSHVVFLCNLFVEIPRGCSAKIYVSQLVRRLVPLMAKEHQESLLAVFPPGNAENVLIWSVLPIDLLPDSAQVKVCRGATPLCIKLLGDLHDEDALEQNLHLFACLRSVYSVHSAHKILPPVNHVGVLDIVNRLWAQYTQGDVKGSVALWCEVLDLTTLLLTQVQPSDYAQILRGLNQLLEQFPSLDIKTSVGLTLGCCGTIHVTKDIETEVFSSIARLFCRLISDSHWMAHNTALQAVKAFVEVTPYTHIMSDCVPEPLLPLLSDFLNQTPYQQEQLSGDTTVRDRTILTQQRESSSRYKEHTHVTLASRDCAQESTGDTGTEGPLEPATKRTRLEENPTNDGEYTKIIQPIRAQLNTLCHMTSKSTPSMSVIQELVEIRSTLDFVINRARPGD
ncbi:uncharacterized protein C1orf112 [Nematostella vectensis]|uniref:uncharacterized protein C1orf112 n=1 Tax=Nematostella vectensis TaxID=45351 RepID=UPI002076DBA4|nr:uncharacterized protein C1orf112 [Nematostella vectensis]